MKENVNSNIGNKQIGINMIANVVSHFASLLISFVLTPFLINTLGKEIYSFYPIANTIVGYMSMISSALNAMASRFVTISLVEKNDEDANKYFSSVLISNICISAVTIIPMIICVVFLEKFMDIPINSIAAIKLLFTLIFVTSMLNVISSIYGVATFAKNRIDLRSIRELVISIIRIVLFFVLYKFLPPSIIYVGVVTLIVAIINVCIQKFYTKKLLPEIKVSVKYFSIKHIKAVVVASSWTAVNSLGNSLLAGMTMVLANRFYGADASGSYSIVQTVPQFINSIIVMLCGVFYPVITYKYAEKDKSGLINQISVAQRFVGVFCVSVITVFIALATEFFELWTPGQNSAYLSLLSFVTIMPHLLISCIWPITNLNIVMNKVKIPAIFTLLCGLANVVLACVLNDIMNIGVISFALISSILQIVWIGVLIPVYSAKNLGISPIVLWKPTFKIVFPGFIIMVVIFILKKLFVLNSWLYLLTFGMCVGICTLLIIGSISFGIRTLLRIIMENINKFTQIND